MFYFRRGATAVLVPGFLCQAGRRRPENVSILSSLLTELSPRLSLASSLVPTPGGGDSHLIVSSSRSGLDIGLGCTQSNSYIKTIQCTEKITVIYHLAPLQGDLFD